MSIAENRSAPTVPAVRSPRRRSSSGVIAWTVLAGLAVFAVFPLVWMVASSLKPATELYRFPVQWVPESISLEHYTSVVGATDFPRFLLNSIVVAVTSTTAVVILSSMAGFGLSRGQFRFRNLLRQSVLVAYVFPVILFVIPIFGLMSNLGLSNSLLGVIVVHVAFNFPFCCWLMVQYFGSLPTEIEEAGRIDGLSHAGVFLRIAVPLSLPGIATTATFGFINSWNEFLLTFVIAGGGDNRTLPVGIYNFVGSEVAEWGPLMASATMTLIPTLLVFFLAQRRIVSGLTAGGVKS